MLKGLRNVSRLVEDTIFRCDKLKIKCIELGACKESIKHLDEISNTICLAIDPLSLCSRVCYYTAAHVNVVNNSNRILLFYFF